MLTKLSKRVINKFILIPKQKRKAKKFYSQLVDKNELVFDIGANRGNRVDPFLRIGARVIAVEPQPNCVDFLRKKFGNRITVIPKGIGEKVGSLTLHISDSDVLSSFDKEWIDDLKKTRWKDTSWEKTVEVEIDTLDNLIDEYGMPKFIKIDTEGFEYYVLRGLSQKVRCVSFEYNTPEEKHRLLNCLDRMHEISLDYKFNYSIGESMLMESSTWMDYHSFRPFAETKEFQNSGFGDVYAKLF